jgi:bacteriocin biosynthesis cyclodehydratase domain-containing protein
MRLKRSIEVFSASDGSVYLLRMGAGDDMVLEEPSAADRLVLAALDDDWTDSACLAERLRSAGLDSRQAEVSLEALASLELLEAESSGLLSETEAERFDRQLIYLADLATSDATATELQLRLMSSSVALLGCGGLGTWAAVALAGAGVGRLVLIDDDVIELSNLNRQMLFTESQIGELKTESARRNLLERFSGLQVETVNRRISSAADLADLLPGIDLLISTADWPAHLLPRWVNQACAEARVPYLSAGQFPPKLRVGPLVVPGLTGCLACQESAARGRYPLYDELVAWRSERSTTDASVSAVSGVIGTLLASEAMQHLIGVKRPASLDTALIIDLSELSIMREPITVDPCCPVCSPCFEDRRRLVKNCRAIESP